MTQAPCNYVPPEKVSSGIACGLILPHMITLSKQLTSAALGPNHITWEFVRNVMSWALLRPNRSGTWTAEPSNLNFNRPCWSLRILLEKWAPSTQFTASVRFPPSSSPQAGFWSPSLLLQLGSIQTWAALLFVNCFCLLVLLTVWGSPGSTHDIFQGLWFRFTPLSLPILAALGRIVHSASTSWDAKMSTHPPDGSLGQIWPNNLGRVAMRHS